jgi:hypothetical protein
MIEAVAIDTIPPGTLCRLEPGTLRLRLCKEGEQPSFRTLNRLQIGDTVSVVPLDTTKLESHGFGIQVGGSWTSGSSPEPVVSPVPDPLKEE